MQPINILMNNSYIKPLLVMMGKDVCTVESQGALIADDNPKDEWCSIELVTHISQVTL